MVEWTREKRSSATSCDSKLWGACREIVDPVRLDPAESPLAGCSAVVSGPVQGLKVRVRRQRVGVRFWKRNCFVVDDQFLQRLVCNSLFDFHVGKCTAAVIGIAPDEDGAPRGFSTGEYLSSMRRDGAGATFLSAWRA